MSGAGNPAPSAELLSRLHSTDVELLPLDSLDPSLAIGFYFRSRREFLSWSLPKIGRVSSASASQVFSVEMCSPVHTREDTDSDVDVGADENEWQRNRARASSDDFVLV